MALSGSNIGSPVSVLNCKHINSPRLSSPISLTFLVSHRSFSAIASVSSGVRLPSISCVAELIISLFTPMYVCDPMIEQIPLPMLLIVASFFLSCSARNTV